MRWKILITLGIVGLVPGQRGQLQRECRHCTRRASLAGTCDAHRWSRLEKVCRYSSQVLSVVEIGSRFSDAAAGIKTVRSSSVPRQLSALRSSPTA